MAEFPALPLWTDAYLGDTTHLTTIEHGAYLLLLMTAWRSPETRLPDDDVRLARYARLTASQWGRIKPVIADFFTVADGWWTQRRLNDEAKAVRQYRDRQAEKGRKSGNARSLKTKDRHTARVQSGSLPVATGEQPKGNLPIPIYSVAKATGAEAPPDDPVKALFDTGIALLGGAGIEPRQARSLIGKWRKAKGDGWVVEALIDARDKAISDPVPWIEARLNGNVAQLEFAAGRRAANRRIAEESRQRERERWERSNAS